MNRCRQTTGCRQGNPTPSAHHNKLNMKTFVSMNLVSAKHLKNHKLKIEESSKTLKNANSRSNKISDFQKQNPDFCRDSHVIARPFYPSNFGLKWFAFHASTSLPASFNNALVICKKITNYLHTIISCVKVAPPLLSFGFQLIRAEIFIGNLNFHAWNTNFCYFHAKCLHFAVLFMDTADRSWQILKLFHADISWKHDRQKLHSRNAHETLFKICFASLVAIYETHRFWGHFVI
jgi:hypothetical protein